MKLGLRQGCPSGGSLWTRNIYTFLVVILLVCSSLSHSASRQLEEAIGSYSGFSLFIIEGEEKTSSYKIDSRRIYIELARNERLVKIENINNDDQLEVWTSHYEGDETNLLLYQINISDGTSQKKSVIMLPIFRKETNARDPFEIITLKDLDDDGKLEVLVNTKTHPLYGSLYRSGNVFWTDIYKITPRARLANSKFKKFYQEKREEIAKEIRLLEAKKRELEESPKSDVDAVHELHIEEAKDQIRVYESWLKAIEEYN